MEQIDAHSIFLGGLCKQTESAFHAWETFFGTVVFNRFIEIGAGHGNMSIFFLMHCMNKGAQYIGYEKYRKFSAGNSVVKRALQLRKHIRIADVFHQLTVYEIQKLIKGPGRTILFCDGGNKLREFNLFVPALKPGDFIAVHDYGTEVTQTQLRPTIHDYNLIPHVPEEWGRLKTLTRMWMKGD